MSISIQFLGAAGCVTGSQFLVTAGERHILVDCGMFQGSPEEIERNRMPFAFDVATLDAVLLTHAHLDHCGRDPGTRPRRLPRPDPRHERHGRPRRDRPARLGEAPGRVDASLEPPPCRAGRRRRPLSSSRRQATDVETDDETLPERLRDAPARGHEPRRASRSTTITTSTRSMEQVRGTRLRRRGAVTDGVTAVFHDAGHILGSAIIELRVADGGATPHDRLLRRPRPRRHADPARPDAAHPCRLRRLIESTYGNREHGPHEAAIDGAGRDDQRGGDRRRRAAGAGVRHRAHPGGDLGPRRPRPRRPHPSRPALPRLADGVARDAGLRRPPRDLRRRDRRAAAGRASRRCATRASSSPTRSRSRRRSATPTGRSWSSRPRACSPAAGSCTTSRTSCPIRRARCSSSATRARGRWAGTSRTAARRRASTGRSSPFAAGSGRSAASRRTPTSTSSRRGSATSAARPRGGRATEDVFIVHGDPDAAEAFAARIRSELGSSAHVAPVTARPSRSPEGLHDGPRSTGHRLPDRLRLRRCGGGLSRGHALDLPRRADHRHLPHACAKFAIATERSLLRSRSSLPPGRSPRGRGRSRRRHRRGARSRSAPSRGDVLVGPDNGLLLPAADALGGIVEARS